MTIEKGATIVGNEYIVKVWGSFLVDGDEKNKVSLNNIKVAFGTSDNNPGYILRNSGGIGVLMLLIVLQR